MNATIRGAVRCTDESARGDPMTKWPASLPTVRNFEQESEGWRAGADDFARFFDTLPNRRDAWGGYWPEPIRKKYGNLRTAPTKRQRGRVFLDVNTLRRHCIGADRGDLMGLHATSPEGLSRWCGFDLDAHDDEHGNPPPAERRQQVLDAAVWCAERLGERLSVLLEDSDGQGGYHVWAHFDRPVQTTDLYHWLQLLAQECEQVVGVRPETYPKQADVPSDGFGSWLRLPGRHHTKPHWSRVCRPAEPWSIGLDAVRTITTRWPASPAELVPTYPAPVAPTITTKFGYGPTFASDLPRNRASVIANYVNKLPHGEAGTERSNKLFSLARFLRHGMQCSAAEAFPILHAWDAGNRPPLGEKKITETWKNAAVYAARPVMLKSREALHHAA